MNRRQLSDSVSVLRGVGPARREQLTRLGINTLGDLLQRPPRRYVDCTAPVPISSLQFGQQAVVAATIKTVSERRGRRQRSIITALLEDDSGTIEAVWFNQSFLLPRLRPAGHHIFVGLVKRHYQAGRPLLSAPRMVERPQIIPLYGVTFGLTSRSVAKLIEEALATTVFVDNLASTDRAALDLPDRTLALNWLHRPTNMEQTAAARRRLVFDQLLALFSELDAARRLRQAAAAPPLAADTNLLRRFVTALPFKLTDDQRRAIWQAAQEMSKATPMHRLLNGDVGSGKTAVAAALSLLTVRAGKRVALMAPTEILVDQHIATLQNLLAPFSISVGRVTSRRKEDLNSDILVGTHAILTADLNLAHVALVIIDEQHRFGVAQREALVRLAAGRQQPHLLALTATPIPRSLALVLFGDLDVSVLKERPAGRPEIKTAVLNSADESVAFDAVRAALARSEQSYVVCPLIEQVAADGVVTDDRQSVKVVADRLSRQIFPQAKIGMLHGQLKGEQKTSLLRRFAQKKLDILVSTSVVEVGVDVPNATVMIIDGAERFGVAQLHQLRGRVGRGERPSLCFLIIREESTLALARAQKVAATTDGFELASFDLAQRGPGELVGLAQKGLNPLFLEGLDFSLLQAASNLARQIKS